jgi:hypothetical protein
LITRRASAIYGKQIAREGNHHQTRRSKMGRARKGSKVLDKAQARAASIKSIDKSLDLGGGLAAAAFDAAVEDARTKLADYNQALAVSDEKLNLYNAAEATLKDLSERILAGVAARYGKNSSQYEQAGGVRKSERKAPVRKPKAKAPAGP